MVFLTSHVRYDAVTKIEECRKKDDETMPMFAERIRQLVERAYPYFTADDKDIVIVYVCVGGRKAVKIL